MVSMISLNRKVGDFIEEYRWNEAEKDPSNSDIIDDAHDKKRVLANYKTEEQQSAVSAESAESPEEIVKPKYRQFFIWITASLVTLFVIVMLAAAANH